MSKITNAFRALSDAIYNLDVEIDRSVIAANNGGGSTPDAIRAAEDAVIMAAIEVGRRLG